LTLISWKARHPERFQQASERKAASLPAKKAAPKKQTLSGRAGKDVLMQIAREIAEAGTCRGWRDVLEAMHTAGADTALLVIWATTRDKDEIDRICAMAFARNQREPKQR
jgi:hypothetical protein